VARDTWSDDPDALAGVEEAWQEPWGDRRQEIVIIGSAMDRQQLVAMLDACLLTHEELAGGEASWATFPDPFGTWEVNST
jgi:hypothetical protein